MDRERPWFVGWLARAIPLAHRDAIVADLLDDYEERRATGKRARAIARLAVDLMASAADSRRQVRLERRERRTHDRVPLFVAFSSELRYAWRQHRAYPTGTLSAVLTIALAVGVNTALVSVTHAVLFRPLPFRDPARIIFIWDQRADRPEPLAPARALDARRRTPALADAALLGHVSMAVTGLGAPERWAGASVSSSFFDVLGAPPEIGQTFHRDDPGRDVVVLSHSLWATRFGADPAVLGRTLVMDGRPRVVLGVMPADFFWPEITATPSAANGPEFWTCAPANDVPEGPISTPAFETNRTAGFLRMVARLAPGATRQIAQAQLTTLALQLGQAYPATDGGHGFSTVSVDGQFFGSVRSPMVFLACASALIVLLACVNVANLLVMRLPARARELAIRVAIGAGRGRLVRQLLTEGVLLATVGGAAGVLLARGSLSALVSMAPTALGNVDAVGLSLPVLLVTVLAVIVCGLVLGALPAFIIWRLRPMTELRTSGVSLATRPGFRQALVAIEVALAVSLVIGAAIFGQSLLRLRHVNVGFDTSRMLTFSVSLVGPRAQNEAQRVAFFDDMLASIRALPDVTSAAAAVTLPIGGDDFGATVYAEGQPLPAPGAERHVGYQIVSPGWFDTLGVRMLEGRDFTVNDGHHDAQVAIINHTMAEAVWPGQGAIGRRFRHGTSDRSPWLTVVGVVADIRHRGPASPPRAEVYEPYYQTSLSFLTVAVRTAHDPMAIVPAVRGAVAALDADQPISLVSTMDRYLTRAYGDETFLSRLTLGFGALALGLAIVGVYGVVGWSSAQRTREFGLRTALGATPGSLSTLVLWQALRPVAAGAAIGAAVALALAQSIRGLLFETTPADPIIYAIALFVVMLAASIACWIPARRASRTDAIRALMSAP
jgi:putative ABC transport system permease protein